MLCSLGDFTFETHQTDLTSINESTSYHFERTQTIAAFDDVQAISKYNKNYEMAGTLLKKSNSTLDLLEQIAEKKKPVSLAFDSGKAFKVIIKTISKNKSLFLQNGVALKCDFSVSLEVV